MLIVRGRLQHLEEIWAFLGKKNVPSQTSSKTSTPRLTLVDGTRCIDLRRCRFSLESAGRLIILYGTMAFSESSTPSDSSIFLE